MINQDPFIEVINILDKYGKLKGTKEELLFSDRTCAAELVKLIRKYVYETIKINK